MTPQCANKKIPPFKAFVLQNFPFLASDKDALELYQKVDYLIRYVDFMTVFINNILEDKIIAYIDRRFDDIMIDAIYDEPTETLNLSINHEGE